MQMPDCVDKVHGYDTQIFPALDFVDKLGHEDTGGVQFPNLSS